MCNGLFSDINYILSFNVPYVICGFQFPRDFTGRVPPGFWLRQLPRSRIVDLINDPGVLQKNPQNFPNPPNYFLCDKYNKWEVVV